MRGVYPKISSKYSEDLSDAIKIMIQVESGARPSCEELLKMPMISKRIEFFNENKDLDIIEETSDSLNKNLQLLKTINVPNKLENLSKSLPKPNYNTEANDRSFQNNCASRKQYGSLTISNTDLPKRFSTMFLPANIMAAASSRESTICSSASFVNIP